MNDTFNSVKEKTDRSSAVSCLFEIENDILINYISF